MKKKTLFVILLIPFIVAILGFVNVIIIKNYVEVDIAGIEWKYDDSNGFRLQDEPYKLEAKPIFDESLILSDGNDLIWKIDDKYKDNGVATITNDTNKNYFLNTLKEGKTKVICSNEKGNKQRSFEAVIYKDGTIIINPIFSSSGENISALRKFGQFDIESTDKHNIRTKKANINFKIKVLPEDADQNIHVSSKSDFIEFNNVDSSMSFNGGGKAFVNFQSDTNPYIKGSYEFEVIENGINVYDYNDLLACTNYSESGEIICLQTNLESLENTYAKGSDGKYKDELISNNTHLFGNFDFKTQKTSFKNEVYKFKTTYNNKYIKQYFKNNEGDYDDVVAGIRIQKDFYGNGFVINGKELTYPNNGSIDKYSGKLTPNKLKGDLFLGPLTFISLGDFNAPIMKVFGQDNSLLYVDGNNITLDDLNILNTDKFADKDGNFNIYNLEYTGTCVDVHGKNVTLQNSRLQNARNCLRVYSSDGFTLKNSVLEKAREFLMKIGNNEMLEMFPNQTIEVNLGTQKFSGDFAEFMELGKETAETELDIDKLIMEGMFNTTNISESLDALNKVQTVLDTVKTVDDPIDPIQNITIEDSYFYRSGIFSIAFDSYFNGPFLYNGAPSLVSLGFAGFNIDITLPDKISGVMLPTNLVIKGDTRFYDWKDGNSIDASCLIEERLGELSEIFGQEKVNIDDYFPMKYALSKEAKNHKYLYINKDTDYLNTPIAWYGGGLNLSTVNYKEVATIDMGEIINVDITKLALTGEGYPTETNLMVSLLGKCVPIAAGFHPFKFITNGTFTDTPYLFGEVPQISDLKNRA